MIQTSNKIQIPIKTKIAAMVAIIIGFCYLISLLSAKFGYFTDFPYFWRDALPIILLPSLIVACCYFLVAFGLFNRWKLSWYFGLTVFGIMSLLFIMSIYGGMVLAITLMGLFLLFSITGSLVNCFILFFVNFVAFIFLLVDRKNYFAAVERAKKGNDLTK
jgi:hypothetical protein